MPNNIDDNIDNNSKNGDETIVPEKFQPITAADIPLSKPLTQTLNPGDQQSADDSSATAKHSAHTTPADASRRWIYSTILIALACVLALFLAIAFQDEPTQELIENQSPSSAEHRPTEDTPTVEETPFQTAQLAAARRSAQDILARVLQKQQTLETLNVQQWAATQYQQALDTANEGDMLYRNRDFKAALTHYETAENLLDTLEAGREPHISKLLHQGMTALNQGRGEAAQQAFENILLIEENHTQALQGLERIGSLPEVFTATQRGEALLLKGDYAGALAEYTLALHLDPLFEAAISGRKEAQRLDDDAQFQRALNQGFQSLHSGNLDTARKQFSQALALKPQSAVAQSGRAQVDNEIAQRGITRLLNSAQDHEGQEQWQMALAAYDSILSRDPAVTAATIGKIRSAARQQLDSTLEQFIAQPLRLASPAVFREAQKSLRDAEQIARAGPRLKQQIKTLSQVLVNAQQPQTVVLHSDNLTRVRLFKVREFTPFNEKTVQLKPGHYIAEGVRPGYRDVRVEFTILPTGRGASAAPIVVQCQEAI